MAVARVRGVVACIDMAEILAACGISILDQYNSILQPLYSVYIEEM